MCLYRFARGALQVHSRASSCNLTSLFAATGFVGSSRMLARSTFPTSLQSTWLKPMSTDVEYRDRPATDMHSAAAAAQDACEHTQKNFRELQVNPGSFLKIALPSLTADVNIAIGAIDTVAVEVTGPEMEDSVQRVRLEASSENVLEVVEVEQREHSVGRWQVRAWIPERFCSVEVGPGAAP
ncbi:hypothetical protein CYMTET_51362 [Cymbomonas tetramitiformis]|uniref:Uncharacterized protein n=1 Tax=Cymbomonas tetramitiformis TaxID=36881 RepID=A0AAE0ES78_9CHLO|nr:hypothetical protein CYMTET_51362 [Cymbomonas tetramitiformis]